MLEDPCEDAGIGRFFADGAYRYKTVPVAFFWKNLAEMKVNKLQVDNSLLKKVGKKQARLRAVPNPAERVVQMAIGHYIIDKYSNQLCKLTIDLTFRPSIPHPLTMMQRRWSENGKWIVFLVTDIYCNLAPGRGGTIQALFCYQLGKAFYHTPNTYHRNIEING